ncbi:VOC family protein [Bradyrhizobium sp. LHD-71]|uniref:VOC family protein n=1 Tax=Bradyrhizobium sp. LHD-71 TaxID=3072141 RepID=UPI00280DEAC1|nr:VOC family protein [Bradyrhizobium sp. LHD-71]MDQ8730950.1 VOC family protein [Bradyrhizobium sp. LHD-71]
MAFSLDHVVIAVADLEAAVAGYRALGFTVYPGGVHHGGVSHNALVIFADGSYFELIAYREPAPEVRWWHVLSRAGEGLVDFALLPESIERDLAAARGRGLDLNGPTAGGRLRPDGARLDWQVVRPKTTDLPFWCGDVTPRTLRVPEGDMRTHANGVTGIASVKVAVSDVAKSAARYAALAGPEAVREVNGGASVAIGTTPFELADDAAARTHVTRRGEGPMSLVLRGPTAKALDLKQTHGADLSIAVHHVRD